MKYIVANWKCNPENRIEAKKILLGYKKGIKKSLKIAAAVCPPACYLETAKEILKSAAGLGGQDCHWQNSGAFTGEISPTQLRAAGCGYVIIGHSERRHIFGETDETINKKVKAALAAGLAPIFCCGETRGQRIDGKITDIVEAQIKEGLKDVDLNTAPVMIAYEPVWAIGTGLACEPDEAAVVSRFIKNITNEKIPLLYGGSVNAKNAASYLKDAGYSGLLVGGASLDPKEFCAIIASAKI
ncbi:MAG: triose-phosphate isomerase [Minisyncoccales bacterium]